VPAAGHEERPAPAATAHAAAPAQPAHHAEGAHGAEHGAQPGAGHGGEHARFRVGSFILQLINFGALLFLLIYFGVRFMNKSLRARHDQLKSEINEAARLRDEAKRKLDAQAQRLAELERELATLRASMREDSEREQARMLEAAETRAQQMQEEMRTQIDEQVKVAEAELRKEVALASVKLAEEIARKAVSFDDDRRLAREFVEGFAGPAGPTGEAR
jgi:F-type H+-transporting ATPase subunit b